MNTRKVALKVVFLFVLLNAACTSVTSNIDREEGKAAVTSKTSDADIKAARSAVESKDYTKAARLLPPLAEQGNPKAQYVLGTLYFNGNGVSKDYAEAMKWFRKAAEQGLPIAQYALGTMYAEGNGVSKDYMAAKEWFQKAAEQGSPAGCYMLGALYADGRLGTSKDFSEAAHWFHRSAEQGYPPAQTALGTLYGRGDGVIQDSKEARKWYGKAAEQEYPDAQWRLGSMYMKGEGIPQDYAEAEKWFRKAASQGDPQGQFLLGHLYLSGLGVSKDLNEAAKWFKLATADENIRAAALYMWAHGDKKWSSSPEEASFLFVKALVVPPDLLALAHLAVSNNLKLAKVAHSGATVHIMEHQQPVTIDESNAESYAALFEERLDTYTVAIQQRGFQQLAREYKTEVTPSCSTLGFSQGQTVFDQDKFKVQVAHGAFQGIIRHRGIIVESTLTIEHALDPDIHLSGQIRQGHIELKHPETDCTITLTAE